MTANGETSLRSRIGLFNQRMLNGNLEMQKGGHSEQGCQPHWTQKKKKKKKKKR